LKELFSLTAALVAALGLSTAAFAQPATQGFSFDPGGVLALVSHATQGRDPKPLHPRRASHSLYEQTTSRPVLRQQGCDAARAGVGGVVILDFGKLAWNGHSYGTILFGGGFAGNRAITRAMAAYAFGYHHCLPAGSLAHIDLARGTSNYHPAVPDVFTAGRKWARETTALSHLLYFRGIDQHVTSAAADDSEPAWDPAFHKTRDFFRGYRAAGNGRTLYNYGSLDGGVGAFWNARQLYFVSGGMRYSRVIPEIYNHTMASEWAELAAVVRRSIHRDIRFAGVMTQYATGCGCSLNPPTAHESLVRALAAQVGEQAPDVPATATNITAAS